MDIITCLSTLQLSDDISMWSHENRGNVPDKIFSKRSSSPIQMFSTNALLWRHNVRDGVLNHQPHICLLSR